jgi:undecaprenyl diphosphate synthase
MLNKDRIPVHVAIIMDGNGRWAKQRGLPRTVGHHEGMKRVKEIVKVAHEMGIKVVTFFAFSSENWNRPKREINMLMRYLNHYLVKEIAELDKNNIRFRVIGRDEPLPESVVSKIRKAEQKTKENSDMTMALAINYGSKQEIMDGVKKIVRESLSGKVKDFELTEETFSRYLYTAGMPDPDLLIRTSGEMRLSNFLLWQLAYAEFYFTEKYWPDFGVADFKQAVEVYQNRERRFGSVDGIKKSS